MILKIKKIIHTGRYSKGIILSVFTFILSACVTNGPPYQTLYEARTAISAAEQKIGPCPCEALTPARSAYEQAKAFNQKEQYHQARAAANQALEQAQDVLRRYQ